MKILENYLSYLLIPLSNIDLILIFRVTLKKESCMASERI